VAEANVSPFASSCVVVSSVRMINRNLAARNRRGKSGQALVETGLVIGLLVIVVLGIVEFGYAFMSLNVITQAATAGARVGATLQVGGRGSCGQITDSSTVTGNSGLVKNQIGAIVNVSSVTLTQTPAPASCGAPPTCASCTFTGTNIPTVTVTVSGSIPYLFGLLGSSAHSFVRSVTFRDEGR
jgi:Flp pilus assembly protein TadG